MADITLTIGGSTIEDCEDAWTANSDVTSANTDADCQVGSASVKIVVPAGAGAGGLLAYEGFSALDLSEKRFISAWFKSSIDTTYGQLQLVLAAAAPTGGPPVAYADPKEQISIPALTANTWKFCILGLENPVLDSAIVSVGIRQAATVDVGAFNLFADHITSSIAKTFTDSLMVKGIDDLEDVQMFPGIVHRDLANGYSENNTAFNRVFTVNLGVLTEKIDRVFMLAWLMAPSKSITYAGETISVSLLQNSGFSSQRMEDFVGAKAFSFQVIEKTARRQLPTSWMDY